MRRITHFERSALAVLLAVIVAACGGATPAPTNGALTTIRLPMGFTPSVQYAPFYAAVDKGYFAAEGIALEFDYSFETNGVQLVAAGQLPFAVVSGEQVLLARAQGLPVVYVFAWFQKFPVAIMSKAGSGITQPAGLIGKDIGTPLLEGANFIGLRALLAISGIPAANVTVQAIGFNQVPALTANQVDAVVVYSNNEPIRLAAQGEALDVINVGDYVPLAANGILTNEGTAAGQPDLVRRFNRALLRGLQDTLADPDGAYTISKKYVEGLTDDAVEKAVLAASIEMWRADRLGRSDPAAWETMQQTLLDAGLLTQAQDLSKTFTNDFVP
jgi:NitT/TauT family transport system substrate-binding protein